MGGGRNASRCRRDPVGAPRSVLLPQRSPVDHGTRDDSGGRLASAAGRPGGNRLVLGQQVFNDGAVGVLLDPGVEVRTVVSQGCRPIGQPFTITKSEGNIVSEMGGRSAVDRLRETLLALNEAERALVSKGLHIGIVIDEHKSQFGRGDFLIRGLIGADEETGALAVGDSVDVGTTVQFQVRDAATADEDFRRANGRCHRQLALVFTCNGRGTHLFDGPDHDAAVVHEALERAPVAGMFCAGELGPISGHNFLHGFTASVVLFHDHLKGSILLWLRFPPLSKPKASASSVA